MSRRDLDLSMPLAEALRKGLVMRTRPLFVCGSRSPESGVGCGLEPGHEGHHRGAESIVTICWANV